MDERLDPKEFGLSSRTCIEKEHGNNYSLVINRKSRLIMSDGRRIAENAEKIRKAKPGSKVSLRTNAPVCTKTKAFLSKIGVKII